MTMLFINSAELSKAVGVTKRQASQLINQVNEELASQGLYVFHTKPPKAPTKYVFEKLGIGEEEWKSSTGTLDR